MIRSIRAGLNSWARKTVSKPGVGARVYTRYQRHSGVTPTPLYEYTMLGGKIYREYVYRGPPTRSFVFVALKLVHPETGTERHVPRSGWKQEDMDGYVVADM